MSVSDGVAAMVRAHRETEPVAALHTRGPLTLEDAYGIQRRVFDTLWGADGVAGYKISLVAPEHRASFGASEPTFGRLAAHQVLTGSPEVPLDSMLSPLVEPELVFIVNRDLVPAAGPDEVLASCHVSAGLEIPESRFRGWFPVPDQTVGDLVADNSFAGLVVHSEHSVPASDVDLAGVTCRLLVDGELFGTGQGTAVMGHPALSVAWLSERLARDGEHLRAGQRISAGTFLWPPVADRGVFEATYDGIGSVRLTFT